LKQITSLLPLFALKVTFSTGDIIYLPINLIVKLPYAM